VTLARDDEGDPMSTLLPATVRAALKNGNKIEAIKRLRAQTSLSLEQARAAVEAGVMPDPPRRRPVDNPSLTPEAVSALASGNKIEAIKLMREATGLGLKQAKALVEQAAPATDNGVDWGTATLAPGEVPRRSGALWLVMVLLAIIAGLAWLEYG